MKKLLLTVIGLTLSLPSFSQKDTIVSNPNQLIPIPKYVLVGVVKDLKIADMMKEENEILFRQIEDQQIYIAHSDSIRLSMKAELKYLYELNAERDKEVIELVKEYNKLNVKVHRQRTWIKGLAIGLAISLVSTAITK